VIRKKTAWKSLKNVTTSFFVNKKASNYHDMVADLVQPYKAMRCNMSFKTHFLDSFLRFLPSKYRGSERLERTAISPGHFHHGERIPRQDECHYAGWLPLEI
jgi:hypothetical protein